MTIDPTVAKRLAAMADSAPWEIADYLVEVFPADRDADGAGRSGLYKELASYEVVIRDEYGVELKASTMRRNRATAIAWPRDARASRAGFSTQVADDGVHLWKLAQGRGLDGLGRPLQVVTDCIPDGTTWLCTRCLP